MNMIPPLTAALCLGFLSTVCCDSPTKDSFSQEVKGWRCCQEDRARYHSGCLSSELDPSFTPPLNYSEASPSLVVWTPHSLKCPWGFKLRYYDTSKLEKLILKEDGVHLQYWEFILKTTNDFCVEKFPSGEYYAATCQPDLDIICGNATCIPKCCGKGERLSYDIRECVSTENWSLSLKYQTIGGSPAKGPSDELVVSVELDCETITKLHPEEDPAHKYYLLPNGDIYELETSERHNPKTYCFEYVEEWSAQVVFVCREPPSKTLKVKTYLQAVGTMISAIFLIITVVFHLCIPELRDMQALCLLCHMSSLTVAVVALFISYVFTNYMTLPHCIINGIILQFSFLVVFFWLNVICFDIWRVIRATVQCIPLTGILASDAKKFKLYCVYAWGGPLAITIVSIVLDNLPDEPHFKGLIRPGFGLVSCWFSGDIELFTYFYGIVALLFLMNVLLLGHTVILLYQAGSAFQCFAKQVTVSAFNRHHLEAFWQRFTLFILMALCWVTEVLSWKIPPKELWILTDVLNSLQGFIVFLIFISGDKKRELVKRACTGAISTVSDATRKISRSNETGVTWHVNTTSTSLSSHVEQGISVVSESQ
ncbi:G-protein coupled receptor Mth2-like isoform X2 [Homarus americanus]|uniref:G-protein coupled receptor Mth2-like isoform X2 n=1 Tax=Homarus americanus TaxID=6706 RepID=UPI001C4871EA|nr:G-protein coupled receptor Mth2-like isoform X2 [Homarus americanus]XP_042230407.1 G-protein coupled receptor Mth2-like isoform X2 [Homarus americanus]XP_042230408.1 G-protein coupled receptor Mth2-like isoform X2 [Homarus americanus]XP_042230410.1 G-protein coupled receptor Mth2-like isoform X2 [Homarus americanus]